MACTKDNLSCSFYSWWKIKLCYSCINSPFVKYKGNDKKANMKKCITCNEREATHESFCFQCWTNTTPEYRRIMQSKSSKARCGQCRYQTYSNAKCDDCTDYSQWESNLNPKGDGKIMKQNMSQRCSRCGSDHQTIGSSCEKCGYVVTEYANDIGNAEFSTIPSTTEIAPISFDDPVIKHHGDVIQKRKNLISKQMIGLAKELLTITLYTQNESVLVENCRFSVGMQMSGQAMQVNLYLKKVKRSDKGKFTWKDIIGDIAHSVKSKTDLPITLKTLTSKAQESSIANFTVDDEWKVSTKDFGLPFIKLLPSARLLVNEELNNLEGDALTDIAYLESIDELNEEVVAHVE